MPNIGDSYVVDIKQAHLEWGTHRHTNTRDRIYGEGYIQIPIGYARRYNIFNRHHSSANPYYLCSSVDGYLDNVELLAAGNSTAGDVYAKQFQGNGNLQTIGSWYHHLGARVGNQVRVTFTGSNSIQIELI